MGRLGDTVVIDLSPFRKKQEFVILWHKGEKQSGLQWCLEMDAALEIDPYDFASSVIKSDVIVLLDLMENPHVDAFT